MIGESVRVIVLDVQGDQVRLGIEAPQELPVHRLEIYEQIRAENIIAAGSDGGALKGLQELLEGERFQEQQDGRREKRR